jgi:hypothetical protein
VEFRKSFCGYVRKEENLGDSHNPAITYTCRKTLICFGVCS